MNKHILSLSVAVLALSITACSTPKKDVAGLSSAIDAGFQGHYGQSVKHEQQAEESQKIADRVLKHWQNDQYWNIDEKQKAFDAAQQATQHRKVSENELCQWLNELHQSHKHEFHHYHDAHGEHFNLDALQHVAAYFKTGSATPYKADDKAIYHLGRFLEAHPEASVAITASTDTVGNAASNQTLSEKRADAVRQLLVQHGAKPGQISSKAIGKAGGPDHLADQKHRVATITLNLPPHHDQVHQINCSTIK